MNAYHTKWNRAISQARPVYNFTRYGMLFLAGVLLAGIWGNSPAEPARLNALQEINFAGLPGDQVQITLQMSQPVDTPASFTIDNPARIAFDLPATKSELAKRSQDIGVGPAKSITAVEVKGRTRVVLNLFNMVPYETRVDGNNIIIVLGSASGNEIVTSHSASSAAASSSTTHSANKAVTGVDFRRGDDGE